MNSNFKNVLINIGYIKNMVISLSTKFIKGIDISRKNQ